MKIICPSGFAFDARKWVFGDLKQLSTKAEDIIFTYLFECAFKEILDPGPYPFHDMKRINVNMLSFADIMAGIIEIRKITKKLYAFSRPCKHCSNVQGLEIDLNEQETVPASAEGIAHLATGEPVLKDVEGDEGVIHKVYFRILRGQDIPTVTSFTKQDRSSAMDIQTALSIEKIIQGDQPGADPISGVRNIRKFIDKQPIDFKEELDEITADLEGGYDPIVSFTCSECRRYQDHILPLDENFFGTDPVRAAKARRKRFMAQGSPKENT